MTNKIQYMGQGQKPRLPFSFPKFNFPTIPVGLPINPSNLIGTQINLKSIFGAWF